MSDKQNTYRISKAHSPVFYLPIPILLQLVFPAFRVLLYVPLLVSLVYPRTVYSPSTEDNDDDATPTSSTLLLPPGEHDVQSSGLTVPGQADSKYGTFPRPTRSMLQQSNPGTRAPTPTPDPTKVILHRSFHRLVLSDMKIFFSRRASLKYR